MRDAFIGELYARAQSDSRIMLVVGDLGYGVVEEYASRFPSQFVNVGVSEQSMMGMASGLARTGYIVFVYSIANFPTLRCLEQIRNDVVHDQANVNIIAVGAGLAYGNLGYTHHAVEDIAIMRALPHLRIICPADPIEARSAAVACLNLPGPKYVRLGRNGEPQLHPSVEAVDVSCPQLLRPGKDVVIAGTGAIVGACVKAAIELDGHGISTQVWSVPTIKPFPKSWLMELEGELPILSVEEHLSDGGFGSAILEAASDLGQARTLQRLALSADNLSLLGDENYLRDQHGLSDKAIAHSVVTLLGHKS